MAISNFFKVTREYSMEAKVMDSGARRSSLGSNPASNHLMVVCKQVLLNFSVTQFADL